MVGSTWTAKRSLESNGCFRSFPAWKLTPKKGALETAPFLLLAKAYLPLKTKMSPENGWLEDVFPMKIVTFKGTFVSSRGCKAVLN